MDSGRTFWWAGNGSIVAEAPSAPFTKSISPISDKQADDDAKFKARIEEKGKGGDEEAQEAQQRDEAGERRREVGHEQPGASSSEERKSQNIQKYDDDPIELDAGSRAAHPGRGHNPINAEIPQGQDIEVKQPNTLLSIYVYVE